MDFLLPLDGGCDHVVTGLAEVQLVLNVEFWTRFAVCAEQQRKDIDEIDAVFRTGGGDEAVGRFDQFHLVPSRGRGRNRKEGELGFRQVLLNFGHEGFERGKNLLRRAPRVQIVATGIEIDLLGLVFGDDAVGEMHHVAEVRAPKAAIEHW